MQKGDYLTKLAKQWGISWQDLAALNGINYPYTIYPGQVLKTGQTSSSEPSPTATLKPTQQPTAAVTKTPKPTTAPTATPQGESETFLYTVQRGEYLVQIAETFNLDWKVIAQLNGLTWPYTIQPGQKLKLPGTASPTATATPKPTEEPTKRPTQQNTAAPTKTPKPTATPTTSPAPTQEAATYTVLKGEHLMQIARKLELSWTAIAQMNQLTWPYTLYPGQVLQLPGPEAGPPPPPLVETESPPASSGETEGSGKTYVVQKGDYLYTLAQQFGVNWQTLAAHNNISYPYIIYSGQVLEIP
ncbi:MAG: LysM peptidoglycan-binding domain-containing protein [Anaerolineales bacterium]